MRTSLTVTVEQTIKQIMTPIRKEIPPRVGEMIMLDILVQAPGKVPAAVEVLVAQEDRSQLRRSEY